MRRSPRHFSALFALAAFVASFALPFVAPRHAWVVDPDAGWDVPVLAGGGTPEVTRPAPAPDGEHCAICHWMRALGSSMVGGTMRRLAVAPPRQTPSAPVDILVPLFTSDRPARAPPVSLA
jgi:hypothetical protein